MQALTGTLRRPPADDEVAKALGLTLDAYHTLSQRVSDGARHRLEDVDHDDLRGAHIIHDAMSVDEHIGRHQLGALVSGAIVALPARLQRVRAPYYQEDSLRHRSEAKPAPPASREKTQAPRVPRYSRRP